VGDLTPTRDFNYVEDTCKGFIAIAKCDDLIGHEVNVGSNFEISVADTLNLIKSIMKSDVTFEVDNARIRPGKSEVQRLWCDNSKIIKYTGFAPSYSIEVGLHKTIQWFLNSENLKKYKTSIYNV
ncbi:MAG: GDP-mannose 4,6-dehydratase, partial [Nitrosopumilus sp.]|nr:GDP-mannose 4,6-dehydratase [Nitrosopumilus sp.]